MLFFKLTITIKKEIRAKIHMNKVTSTTKEGMHHLRHKKGLLIHKLYKMLRE